MPVSRLLKSCAMPPVSWPTASIFCDWRSASSVSISAWVRAATWDSSSPASAREVLLGAAAGDGHAGALADLPHEGQFLGQPVARRAHG